MLAGLRTHLLAPELIEELAAEYVREVNRLSAERNRRRTRREDELARATRQIGAIVEAIKEGLRTPAMKDELFRLEKHKVKLEGELADTLAPTPVLHPALAELYRTKVANLIAELNRPELRAQAVEILRSLIDEIRLIPENGKLEIEINGDLAGILALEAKRMRPAQGMGGPQVTMVAGTGFEPVTFRL